MRFQDIKRTALNKKHWKLVEITRTDLIFEKNNLFQKDRVVLRYKKEDIFYRRLDVDYWFTKNVI